MNAEEVYDAALAWANEYDSEFAALIKRDYNYFTQIMNIEREIEKPRKDYEKYSDVKKGRGKHEKRNYNIWKR